MNRFATNHENENEWSFVSENDDEKERMCRSLDLDAMTASRLHRSSVVSACDDRSEPSLVRKVKDDDPGLFGSQRVRALLDVSRTKESFRDKLLSMWTNTKNGVFVRRITSRQLFRRKRLMSKLMQEFKETSDIWMLGRCYENDVVSFKKDFYKLPWITYRRGFPALGPQRMTSDVGWGCMIRCAQMCLAVTLNQHFQTRGETPKSFDADELLKMFGDKPHPGCPFSIHALVSSGETKGRQAGSWFGPASISVALREVLKERQAVSNLLENLAIYIAQDSTVFIRDALEEMKRGQRSLMLIVPLRLGFRHVNDAYLDSFKRVFRWKYCTGVMGGRPKHSLYFVGYQDDDLIYLDPHFNQDVVDLDEDFAESYHCSTPMKINVAKVDPTCAVAFYCASQTDLWDLIALVRKTEEELKKSKVRPGLQKQIPMLHFVDARHLDFLDDYEDDDEDGSRKAEVARCESIKCDSLESNFCSLEEPKSEADLESYSASGQSSVLDSDESVADPGNAETISGHRGSFQLRVGGSTFYDYSILKDAKTAREAVAAVDRNDCGFRGERCRPMDWTDPEGRKEFREEDGFVVL